MRDEMGTVSPLDMLTLPRELRRLVDVLEEIGPERIAMFLAAVTNVVQRDPDMLSVLVATMQDLNRMVGPLLGWKVHYDTHGNL